MIEESLMKIVSTENFYEELSLNPFYVVRKGYKQYKGFIDDEMLKKNLDKYLYIKLNIKDKVIRDMIIELARYDSLDGCTAFLNYMMLQVKLFEESKYNITATYNYMLVDAMINAVDCIDKKAFEVMIKEAINYNEVSFLDILSDYINLFKFIEFKDFELYGELVNISSNIEIEVGEIDLMLFLQVFFNKTDKYKFKKSLRYILSNKRHIGVDVVKKIIDKCNGDDTLVELISEFCNKEEARFLIEELLMLEYKNGNVFSDSVKMSMEKYVSEYFFNNDVVYDINLNDIEYVGEIVKRLRMKQMYKNILA